MSFKSILKELFKSDYKITSIKRYDSGLIKAQTSSLRWGDDFSLLCIKEEQIPYAKKCLAFLDAMQEDMEARLRKYLFRYYGWFEQFLDDNDKARIGTITEESILSNISIHSVIVDDNCREDIVEFHVEGRCDWEPEHGLEITISDGKILYVGSFDDYPPNSSRLSYLLEHYGYYDPDADPSMNYADKE